ncbi:MAG: ATP-binding protein, partial [Candidatus Saccharimonadales bacterium]
VGRITGTIGGELVLKEHFAYPIATYQDLKRDTMQALLNALSTLTKEDGAGIQFLLRPADSSWRKAATAEADKKRKGGKSQPKGPEAIFWWIGQLFTALNKPPEATGPDKEAGSPEISSLDQSIIQAIEEKTKQPGYEVLIRLVASSNISHRAQTILNNLVATFSLFDAPGKNGFKFVPAKDIESFVTAYILRFFTQGSGKNILNATELATLFHFPDQKNIPTSQLERQASKQVDGPRNIPEEGLLLGYNMFRGTKKAIRLADADRARHMYVVGQTGTGKSTFLENLALQDMLSGRGFAFVDPHGDTAEKLLAMVPKERTEDVIYFCPADMEYPMGLNMFEAHSTDQKDFLIQEAINMLYKLYDPQRQGIIGPRYEHLFRNAALAIMADPAGGTFVDIPKLFRDPSFVEQKLKHVTDQNVLEFWRKEMPASQRSNEFGEVTSWFVSKFGAFLSNEMMRNIIGQTKSSFNLREVMDEGKILLVNLSRGRTGDLNSKLLGMIFVMKFEAAAMSRADVPEEYRRDFCLYVDEFQNFSTDSFADILSQARKYHLNLIVANQFTTQLSEEIRDAVFGNVGSVACFRVGTNDAEFLAKQYAPVFDIDDLQFLPNANTAVRMMIGGVPVQPFSMATLPPLGNPNTQLATALKQLSAAKYGRPKATVEAEIFQRLKTEAPARPSFGASPFGSSAPGGFAPSPNPAAGPRPPAFSTPTAGPKPASSFLDEWLAKRKAAAGAKPPIAASPQTVTPQRSEIKIDQSQPAPTAQSADEGVVHIDKEGNLTT